MNRLGNCRVAYSHQPLDSCCYYGSYRRVASLAKALLSRVRRIIMQPHLCTPARSACAGKIVNRLSTVASLSAIDLWTRAATMEATVASRCRGVVLLLVSCLSRWRLCLVCCVLLCRCVFRVLSVSVVSPCCCVLLSRSALMPWLHLVGTIPPTHLTARSLILLLAEANAFFRAVAMSASPLPGNGGFGMHPARTIPGFLPGFLCHILVFSWVISTLSVIVSYSISCCNDFLKSGCRFDVSIDFASVSLLLKVVDLAQMKSRDPTYRVFRAVPSR